MHRYMMLALAEGFGEGAVAALLAPDLDVQATLAAPHEAPDLPPRVVQRLCDPQLGARAQAVLQSAAEQGLTVLTPANELWPPRLHGHPLRPLVLFVRGDPAALTRQPSVALVGSRTPTPYGIDAATKIASTLTNARAVLWSGLARGIDAIAHSAATERDLPTVAVLGGGLDRIYPSEHDGLARQIVQAGGAVVSELPPGRRARRGHFVRRNRLLAMGADAVVVVEGSLSSGALHTARFAADCGTDVFALPGPWQSERSQGCHRLIAEGAGILESADELLRALGLAARQTGPAALALVHGADEQRLLQALQQGPRPSDLLQRESGLERITFLRAVFRLEQRGLIGRLPGDLLTSR